MIEGYGWTFLEYFRFQTIPIFSTYYDTTLWEVMLAQISISQATLQYTAVAFAATHHEYESKRRCPTKNLDMTNQESAVAILYIDAVSKARQALAEASSTAEAVRTGFIMSLMLAATESLRNSTECVTMHLTNGLKIAFSQGYEIIKTNWKPCEPDLALKDAALAFIQRLKVTIEKELGMTLRGHRDTYKSTCIPSTKSYTTEQLRDTIFGIYLELSGLIDHLVLWQAETSVASSDAPVFFTTLEIFSQRLQHLGLNGSKNERHKLRFLRLYKEATHLLLLCYMNDLTSSDKADFPQSHANSESISNYLRAYFSKLGIIEEKLRHNDNFITHLTPAQLKRIAARYSCTTSPSHPMFTAGDTTPTHTLYGEVEQLIMLEEDAIIATGLVPAHATCMDVTSALEQGFVSIRYCIVQTGGTSFEWVEKRASLWKPAIFKQHQIS